MTANSNILPSNNRMLHAIRSTLGAMKDREPLSALALSQLGVVDQMINEMMLRIDVAPYAELYGKLMAALGRGLSSGWFATSGAGHTAILGALALPETLDPKLSAEAFGRHLNDAFLCVTRLTEVAVAQPGAAPRAFIDTAVSLELEFYTLRRRQAPEVPSAGTGKGIELSIERLGTYLAGRFPDRGYAVTDLKMVPGGYQKTTAIFEARDRLGGIESFVIRADKPDKFSRLDASWVVQEYDIVRYAHAQGVPTAEPKWLEPDAAELGAPFMVTSKVAGKATAVTGVGVGDSPAKLLGPQGVRSIFETLAYIHSRPVEGLAGTCIGYWLECDSLRANTAKAVELWKAQPYWWPAKASPTLSGAMTWLERNVPDEDGPVSLTHVDFGTHNLMTENSRVTAVLDWESARIGDPAEDVTFMLFSLGADVDREQALAWYRDAGGPALSGARLRYFDVYNKMKFAISGAYSAGLLEEDGAAAIEWSALALHIMGGSAAVLMAAIEVAAPADRD